MLKQKLKILIPWRRWYCNDKRNNNNYKTFLFYFTVLRAHLTLYYHTLYVYKAIRILHYKIGGDHIYAYTFFVAWFMIYNNMITLYASKYKHTLPMSQSIKLYTRIYILYIYILYEYLSKKKRVTDIVHAQIYHTIRYGFSE